jgi:hypothetical protein
MTDYINTNNISNDPLFDDPDLAEMAREFKRILREEQEELEAISSAQFESEIDMAFAALEMMWSGDRVRISIGERFLEGNIIHVGKNIIQMLTTPGVFVDIALYSISNIFIVEKHSIKGRAAMKRDPHTFIARLRELADLPMQEVEIGFDSNAAPIVGILSIVRSDHVVVRTKDKREWLVPLAKAAYCITRPRV